MALMRRMMKVRVESLQELVNLSVEEQVLSIATGEVMRQLSEEGLEGLDTEIHMQLMQEIKSHISQMLTRNTALENMDRDDLAMEVLTTSNIANFKTFVRNLVLNKQDKHDKKRWYVIAPGNRQKLIWDLFNVILLTYSIFETPFSLAFLDSRCDPTVLDNINLFIDCCFCLDCLLQPFSAYVDSETGITIVDPLQISWR